MAVSAGGIPQILFGEKDPVEHSKPLFAPGTQPMNDASADPAFDEVLGTYHDIRAINLILLGDIGDGGHNRGLAPHASLDRL